MVEIAERITIDPEQCGGTPCIRGMRIRVTDVLDLLASGLSQEQILDECRTWSPRIYRRASGMPPVVWTIQFL